jgi:peptide/nickel transport system ATP-binding protein
VVAVDDVSLGVREGECVGLVGESGSGKSTLGRCILRLLDVTQGSIYFEDQNLVPLKGEDLRRRRREFQMIFQDPYGSLNPRMSVGQILSEPLEVHDVVPAEDRSTRVAELLDLVGLSQDSAQRYPHEFSGGQRQRIGVARALAPEPKFIVADEPVSALDVSVRAQIINLLMDLRDRLGLSLLFIAHDLAVVEQIADRVAVMYLGRIIEFSETRDLFARPQHPYTVSLLSAVPVPDPTRKGDRIILSGEVPSPMNPPQGCKFHPRCPIAQEMCQREEPVLTELDSGQKVACHFPGEFEPAPQVSITDGTF